MSSRAVAAHRSETTADVVPQLSPTFDASLNTADIVVETMIAWGATHGFGIVGDGVNSVIEALRKRQDRIRYEEAGAAVGSKKMPFRSNRLTGSSLFRRRRHSRHDYRSIPNIRA
jgi:hypothetical protein